MKFLSKEIIENKKVLLRCDFNVPVKDGIVLDDSKIIKSLETINFLLNNNNHIIILSHFGRVKKEEDKVNNSLKVVYNELQKYIDVTFMDIKDLNQKKVEESKCILLENTRFTDIPEKKESANDLELAKFYSSFADVFVMDAFGASHRLHSSTAGVANYLPVYIGFLMEKEIENLKLIVENPLKPFIVIMGGAKVDDKIPVIKNLITKCDKLILTGGILNSFLKQIGINVGKSLVNSNEDINDEINQIVKNYSKKLAFSKLFVVEREGLKPIDEIEDDDVILDNIINENKLFEEANTIFINGTNGVYENNLYESGTKGLFELLKESDAKVIAGGGDTASAIKKFKAEDSFQYISSGGGATLEYLSEGKIKVLEYYKNIDK